MAKPNASPTARTVSRRRRAARIQRRTLGLLVLGVTASLIALPSLVVAAVGFVPALVAYIIDLTPGRYAFRCVAALNVAGVAPAIHRLWTSGANDMAGALAIVSDVYVWLTFYGAAAIGWLLFLGLPGVVATVMTLNAQRRAARLRRQQEGLVAEWGRAVRHGPQAPLDFDEEDEPAAEVAAAA